jgi:hypothetical protein
MNIVNCSDLEHEIDGRRRKQDERAQKHISRTRSELGGLTFHLFDASSRHLVSHVHSKIQ